ncbi:MAG: NADH-quinone oxidoreductase subunit M [Nitrospirota bacterium]
MDVLLSIVIFLPAAAAALLPLLRGDEAVKRFALAATLVNFALSLPLWAAFDPATPAMQYVAEASWIPRFDIYYRVGLDGISLPLVLLTTGLMPICVLCSWRAIDRKVTEFMISLLLMETAMIGVFAALDFVLFYIFWEAMLIPMYLIIGVWGGPNRLYAAIKFFLYTLAGSLLLLVALLALYFEGGRTFDLTKLMGQPYSPLFQQLIFLAFFLAFAIKVPMFPFHTWLPDAHVEAPTAGSVILASVLLKMGAYGFLRFCLPMTPYASQAWMPWIAALSVIAIVYGAYMALAQDDLKKLIAYSSVSHMGFVTLGIFVFNAQGIEGALLQMINHGIATGALFLCVGVLYDRTHSRLIADYGGLARTMPLFAVCLMIFVLSSLGLPGTNSFVGEFLVLVGAFRVSPFVATLAALGIILAAVYLLWMVQRVMFGVSPPSWRWPDLSWREAVTLVPLVGLVFWIGFYPDPFLSRMHSSVAALVQQVNPAAEPESNLLVRLLEPFR